MVGQVEVADAGEREAVLALHRAGKLERARAGYERLLAAAPEDADLLGLLGVVALQQRRAAKAEELLRRAAGEPHPDPRIHLRNVNNLFALFRERGQAEAAAELAGAELPDWPADAPPDAAEQARVLSLAEALALAGRPERGAALLEGVLAHPCAEAALYDLAGRLRLECGEAAAAVPHLQRACASEPGNWQALAALSAAHSKLGRQAEARAAAQCCGQAAPVYLAPRRAGQEATILVLNPAPAEFAGVGGGLDDLHFTKNFIIQASRMMAGEFRFASVFADLPGPAPKLPEADLVFNNLASGERLGQPGRLEQAVKLVERIGRPVINHPEAVFQMTRQKAAALLQDIPGLRVPRIARYWRDLSQFDEIAADIAAQFTYPVIVRHVAADSSAKLHKSGNETAIRVADANELRCFLERISWPQFYVIQYVDLRKADGNYRKVRASFVGGEIIMSRCQFHDEWMVGAVAGAEFYGRFPDRAADMQRILRDPEAMLGSQLMPALEAIRDAVPLDLFALDFDVDDDGRVVLFEVQSAMILIPTSDSPDYAIAPKEPGERILEAFRRLVRAKINTSA